MILLMVTRQRELLTYGVEENNEETQPSLPVVPPVSSPHVDSESDSDLFANSNEDDHYEYVESDNENNIYLPSSFKKQSLEDSKVNETKHILETIEDEYTDIDVEKRIQHLREQVENDKTLSRQQISDIYNEIGNYYESIGDFETAYEYHTLDSNVTKNTIYQYASNRNRSTCLRYLNKLKTAKKIIQNDLMELKEKRNSSSLTSKQLSRYELEICRSSLELGNIYILYISY